MKGIAGENFAEELLPHQVFIPDGEPVPSEAVSAPGKGAAGLRLIQNGPMFP